MEKQKPDQNLIQLLGFFSIVCMYVIWLHQGHGLIALLCCRNEQKQYMQVRMSCRYYSHFICLFVRFVCWFVHLPLVAVFAAVKTFYVDIFSEVIK